jgi:murein L,D-transpeptidase YafK
MYLMEQGIMIKEYRIALGKSPEGHKRQEGDQRTPEGRYILDGINPDSKFYKSMHINYPNPQDLSQADENGVSAGGDISIHGIKLTFEDEPAYIQSFDWTNGCIAITNQEMDEFLSLVESGTPIEIEW